MPLLLLTLLNAHPSPCDLTCDLSAELRAMVDEGPGVLETLLAEPEGTPERELGVALEVLLVLAEHGQLESAQRLADRLLAGLDPDLGEALQALLRTLLEDVGAARDADDLAAALAEAQDRLGVDPAPAVEPAGEIAFEPETPTIAMVTPEHAGGSWATLQDAQAGWEAGHVRGTAPLTQVPNDHGGGYQAGLDGLMLVIGGPGSYSHDFLDGWYDGSADRHPR